MKLGRGMKLGGETHIGTGMKLVGDETREWGENKRRMN